MAANKRYYWLKMKKSFWDEPSVLFLRNLPSGDTLVIIYLKLLCMSLQNNGIIYFEGTYGTVEDEIALSLREDKMMVQMALSAMKQVNLVVMGMDDLEMQFTRIGEMVGIDSESASAKRVREHRARKALEQQQVLGVTMKQESNAVVTNGNTEIEKDKEIETEKESEGLGLYRNVFLTPEEYQNLKDLYPADYMQKINNLSIYMVSANKNYQNHYMTICRWAREDAKREKTQSNTSKQRLVSEMDYSFKEGESL
ncbi:phage replisome organizer N-terminal domain-containing protein [Mediterraneibacter gnavus]|uniref:Phage replisome organiser N-terminal domain-containing protein n=1 Tax=Mediterraneibacter gnavus TaxID=33038 RepID=A0A2N5Q020_MEDGN|nr:phage replisome organizer N-terminal domain-containing protein [Mediterraneibacter gnavus]PLT87016.1 hypothetical protein CDL20_07750 [Mediterraneibacter gnavus]